jgi:RNA polymerase sigma-70 factor (ECF subfamily)
MSAGSSQFLPTRWSLVRAAGGGHGEAAGRAALDELARGYWYPLYGYLRRQGLSPAEAEDLTQGFFAELVEKRSLAEAGLTPAKGRFRAFLLACMKHYLANERDRARAHKRGGGRRPLPLDAAEAKFAREPAAPAAWSPERLFERQWALTVLEGVMAALEADYRTRGQQALFDALKGALTGAAERYADIAAALGINEGAVKTAVHRLRRRYRDLLRERIAQTVETESEVDEEIAYLMGCLG